MRTRQTFLVLQGFGSADEPFTAEQKKNAEEIQETGVITHTVGKVY